MPSAADPQTPLTPPVNVICEGAPRAMGAAQGSALQATLHVARQSLGELEAFRLRQPRWLPFPLYRAIAEHKAERFFRAALSGPAAGAAEGGDRRGRRAESGGRECAERARTGHNRHVGRSLRDRQRVSE